MIKILHTADIHLDSPFSLYDVKKSAARKAEMRGTFTSLMLYAKTEKYDIMIISGDLFDTGFATSETLELVADQFRQNPKCRFVIAPGNHDPFDLKSPYRKVDFPDNVYIFTSDEVTKFSFDDIGVDVYGWAFTDSVKATNPLKRGTINLDKNKYNILAVHADFTNGPSENCPISERDIAASGFDYVALGHIHMGGEIHQAGNTYYAYSGCLEGRSFDECGPKGVIVLKIEDIQNRAVKFGQKKFSKRRYEKTELDISGNEDSSAIHEMIRQYILKNKLGEDTLLRVKLYGVVSPKFKPDLNILNDKSLGVFYFELVDATSPTLDYKELMNDISIRGAFFRELLPMLNSEDEEERKKAADALRYGLSALEGNDIADF